MTPKAGVWPPCTCTHMCPLEDIYTEDAYLHTQEKKSNLSRYTWRRVARTWGFIEFRGIQASGKGNGQAVSGTPFLSQRCSTSPSSLAVHLSHSHFLEDWLSLLSVQVMGVRVCSQLPSHLFKRAAPAVVDSSSHSSKRSEIQLAEFELIIQLLSSILWPGDHDYESKHSAYHRVDRSAELDIVNVKFFPVWCWVRNCRSEYPMVSPSEVEEESLYIITEELNNILNWGGTVLSPGDMRQCLEILWTILNLWLQLDYLSPQLFHPFS